MKRIMVVFGTRPEAIKMCPLVKELKTRKELEVIVCVTGQHREMLDQVLKVFDVTPDYDLSIMKKNQSLSDITRGILEGINGALVLAKPDMVLVHGDTTTTFTAALACFYRHIPVGHIEAGLRTHDMDSPFPEEFNRQAVGLVAALHFAPTETAKENLIGEGKNHAMVFVTGNTAIDALKTTIHEDYAHEQLDWAAGSRLIILTAHRRENLGDSLLHIFGAVRRVVEETPDIKVIYPVHMNPAVRKAADRMFGKQSRIRMVEPLSVLDFHNFMAHAFLILTDSGGIQEEAPSMGKPVLVMRNTTERPEGVAAGTLLLTGTGEEDIYNAFHLLLKDQEVYGKMSHSSNPYGNGFACVKIADILEANFPEKTKKAEMPQSD